jgi:glutamate:Na+ symporter, ESS family
LRNKNFGCRRHAGGGGRGVHRPRAVPAARPDYQAAVLSAGFTGLSFGATPTAIASMTAVTEHYGPSPNAFIILPLVSAFFVDIINVIAIKVFLAL